MFRVEGYVIIGNFHSVNDCYCLNFWPYMPLHSFLFFFYWFEARARAKLLLYQDSTCTRGQEEGLEEGKKGEEIGGRGKEEARARKDNEKELILENY